MAHALLAAPLTKPSRWTVPGFALLVGTGCANPETAAPCSTTPHEIGPRIEIEAATAQDTPRFGEWPALATNGDVHLAVWVGGASLYSARLGDDGEPLDVPAREIPSEGAYSPAVAWDGARFAIAWPAASHGIRVAYVSSDGVPAAGSGSDPAIEIPEADVQTVALASNGTTALAVWTTYPPSGLRGARIGNDGALLDSTPLTIAPAGSSEPGAPPPDVAWDGSNFVAVWAEPSSTTARAARISAAGVVLDPGGIDTTMGPRVRLLGTGAGTVAAWTDGEALRATRLSTDLTPLDPTPVLVDTTNPEVSTILSPSVSRSADGTIVIGHVLSGDTSEDIAAVARAFDAGLQPLGGSLSQTIMGGTTQALVGLSGASHLVVRDGRELRAGRLVITAEGLTAATDHPIFLGAREQSAPAVASNEEGHLVSWIEEGASDARLRARFTGLDGAPTGDVFELGTSPIRPIHAAARDDRFFVAWPKAGPSFELTTLAAGTGVVGGFSLAAALPQASALACTKAMCLVAWSELVAGQLTIRGVRLAADGASLDPDPRTLSVVAASVAPFERSISIVPKGSSLAVLWRSGAVIIDPQGNMEALPGFTPLASDMDGLPLAAGGDRLLAVRTRNVPSGPAEQWAEIFRWDGASVGKAEVGWLGAAAAVWDGGGFLVGADGDRTFVVGPDAALAEPKDGLATSFAIGVALGAGRPGYVLRAGVDRPPPVGAPRVFVQSLVRSCE